MESAFRKNYFVIVKTVGLLALIFIGLLWFRSDMMKAGQTFFLSSLFMLFSVFFELDTKTSRSWIWLVLEGSVSILSMFLVPVTGIYFCGIFLLDAMVRLNVLFFPLIYLLVPVAVRMKLDTKLCFVVFTFLLLLYYQHHKIVSWYKEQAQENIREESKLKSDIEHTNLMHKDEMNQSRLRHENELLGEKNRISQALHDKLGHSINGSLFQLEAAKVLMDQDKEKSRQILQDVIDNLRGSMDEIRVIIRNERPDKKRMALTSLQTLCSECEEKYQINMELTVDGDEKVIPEPVWEVILDNTFEAVTNALKYSGCDTISISIRVLGEVVRATIQDNGRGAEHFEESMGISGMKDRVRKVNGYIDIDPVNGFTINMILPLERKQKQEPSAEE